MFLRAVSKHLQIIFKHGTSKYLSPSNATRSKGLSIVIFLPNFQFFWSFVLCGLIMRRSCRCFDTSITPRRKYAMKIEKWFLYKNWDVREHFYLEHENKRLRVGLSAENVPPSRNDIFAVISRNFAGFWYVCRSNTKGYTFHSSITSLRGFWIDFEHRPILPHSQ